jgi:hypothetical protein
MTCVTCDVARIAGDVRAAVDRVAAAGGDVVGWCRLAL